MIDSEKIKIDRIIIHRVFKKAISDEYGIAEYAESIYEFGLIETETLKDRITTAFSKKKRFFKLEIAQSEAGSFYDSVNKIKGCTSEEFIEKSKSIADLLAVSHDKRTIPGGLLLVMDGVYDPKNHFTLVIKAELQEAFTIRETSEKKLVELINDLFLSPAKDFYKIGYVIEDNNTDKTIPNDKFSAYMYDDNFRSGKRDLAEYFYHTFLGLSTDKNDKLLNKKWYNDIGEFIESNVANFEDKRGLRNALNVLLRENTTGVINPQEFAELHFDEELLRRYMSEVGVNYPHSFNKDVSLIDRKLQRGKINLIKQLKIEGPVDSIESVNVMTGANIDIDALRLSIENGDTQQVITIKTKISA
mgnify:CR=1 FL=1